MYRHMCQSPLLDYQTNKKVVSSIYALSILVPSIIAYVVQVWIRELTL